MVLKRFVKGITQEAFFQKRAPEKRPEWIDTATLHYASGNSAEEVVVRDAAALAWVVNLGCIDLNPHPVRAEDLDHPDELRVDLDPMPGVDWQQIVDVAMVAREVLADHGLVGWPKTSGSRGMHIYVRIEPRWDYPRGAPRRRDPRPGGRAAGARLATAQVVEGGARRERLRRLQPEREGPHGRVGLLGPPAARRPRVDAAGLGRGAAAAVPRGSPCPTVLERFAERGDPCAGIDDAAGRLDGLLPSPRSSARPRSRRSPRRVRAAASTMPLIEIARTKTKPEALEGLERWKAKHPDVVQLLEPADVLVDGMRGSSSLWYRIRVNLQHVPEDERPVQAELEVDYDPWARKDPTGS